MPSLPLYPLSQATALNVQTDVDQQSTIVYAQNDGELSQPTQDGSSSPIAPQYSPITPKVLPVLPVTTSNIHPPSLPPDNAPPPSHLVGDEPPRAKMNTTNTSIPANIAPQPAQSPSTSPIPQVPELPQQPQAQIMQETSPMQPTPYIPQPPTHPFSSATNTDAIALRAAISTLQIQKHRAQADILRLESLRSRAVEEPERFKEELATGKLRERARTTPDIDAILAAGDRDAEDEDDEEVLVTLPGVYDSTNASTTGGDGKTGGEGKGQLFGVIPGPQDVVRMPYVNWAKYGIVGEPLDRLHEQQRRWPGEAPWGAERGRERVVAAPWSPFYDGVDGRSDGRDGGGRKDSGSAGGGLQTPGGAGESEHPMSTRSRT